MATVRTLTNTYLLNDGTTPASGYVTFTLLAPMPSGDETIADKPRRFDLDTTGSFSGVLVATDDADVEDMLYEVAEVLHHDPRGAYRYYIEIPAAGSGPIELNDLPKRLTAPGFHTPGPVGPPGPPGTVGTSGNIFVVPDYPALRALAPNAYARVQVSGDVTTLTGIAGDFLWDGLATNADNGGTWIKPTVLGLGAPGRWKRVYTGARNVKWFGARGLSGGATYSTTGDDCAALQTCYYAGPGAIYHPQDIYPVMTTLIVPSDVTLFGDGPYHSIIDGTYVSGTILDTSVPGSSPAVATVIWMSGSVVELTGFAGARAGDNVLSMADTTSLNPQDVLIIENRTPYSFSSARSDYAAGEMVRIAQINSGIDVRLERPLYDNYDLSYDLHLWKMIPTTSTINAMTVLSKPFWSGIHWRFGCDQNLMNINCRGTADHNLWIDRCYECSTTDCNEIDTTTNQRNCYGTMIGNSQRITLNHGNKTTGRHGVTTGGDSGWLRIPSREIAVNDARLVSVHDTSIWSDFQIVATTNGSATVNEVQTLSLKAGAVQPTTGQYILGFKGRFGLPLAMTATAAQIQTNLEQLPTIGVGNVLVSGGPLSTGPVVLTYRNALGLQDLDLAVVESTVGITTITPGVAGTNEVQQVDARGVGAGNTWTLALGANATIQMPGDCSLDTVEMALRAIPTIGPEGVWVDGGPSATALYSLHFMGPLGNQNVATLTATATQGTGAVPTVPTITTLTPGVAGTNEVQRIDARAIGAAGTWALLHAGMYTVTFQGDVNAALIQSSLEALPNVGVGGATVAVTAGDSGTTADLVRFDVTFTGRNGSRNIPRMRGGLQRVQTPYAGNNHGNIEYMKWNNCHFIGGASTGGDHVEYNNCTFDANAEQGVALLLGEMKGPNVSINGGVMNARYPIAATMGLMHGTLPVAMTRTGTLKIHGLKVNMGAIKAVSGYTAVISIENGAFDPIGAHPPYSMVSQQDIDLDIADLHIDSTYPTGAIVQAYWLNVWASAAVDNKGFRNIALSNVVTNGMGMRIYNNDPKRLSVKGYRSYDARENGVELTAPRGVSRYPAGIYSFDDAEIIGSYALGIKAFGTNNGADGIAAPGGKTFILHDSTLLDNAVLGGATTTYQSNSYVAGFTTVDSKHNVLGETATGSPPRTRVDAYDYITNLTEERNRILGAVTAENRGIGGTVTQRLLHRVAGVSPIPTGVVAAAGSTWINSSGAVGAISYTNVDGTGTGWRAMSEMTQFDTDVILAGAQAVANNVVPPGIRIARATTLREIRLKAGTAPVGASLTIRLNINGVAFGTTASILTTATTGSATGLTQALAVGDEITFDVTSIGSTTAGADIRISLIGF